jgi:hypothetical protein
VASGTVDRRAGHSLAIVQTSASVMRDTSPSFLRLAGSPSQRMLSRVPPITASSALAEALPEWDTLGLRTALHGEGRVHLVDTRPIGI